MRPWKWMTLKRFAYTLPWDSSFTVLSPWVEERVGFIFEVKTWVWMEKPIVQILVVVVITKMRSLWTEVENGFQWRAFRLEWVDPKRFVKHDKKCEGFLKKFMPSLNWKGKWLKFHYLVKRGSGFGRSPFACRVHARQLGIFMYLRRRNRTLRLGREEGAEISSLFKRKEGSLWGGGMFGGAILLSFNHSFRGSEWFVTLSPHPPWSVTNYFYSLTDVESSKIKDTFSSFISHPSLPTMKIKGIE